MIFGYYHITMRTVNPHDVPEIQFPPNAIVAQKVKVGHMLFIPFIPLDKLWMIESGGKSYKLNPQQAILLNQRLGKRSNPWYSFFGLIAIPVLIAFFSIYTYFGDIAHKKRQVANFEKTLAENIDRIDNPTNGDILFFKDAAYKKLGIQVIGSTTDSIHFLSPIDNEDKRWHIKNWAIGFFEGDNPTKKVAFAKADLKKTFSSKMYGSQCGIPAGPLPLNGKIKLEKTHVIDKTKPVPVVSVGLAEEVKNDFKHYLAFAENLDSIMVLSDSAIHQYYKGQLTTAAKADKEIVQGIKKERRSEMILYELLMYTRFVYLRAGDGEAEVQKRLASAFEDLKDYIFFLRLTERGLLTLESNVHKEVTIHNVVMPNKEEAMLTLRAPSNILKSKKPIAFTVKMKKEEGRWKVNLPSTYNYTHAQVNGTSGYGGNISKQWREMIRENFGKLEGKETLDAAWVY